MTADEDTDADDKMSLRRKYEFADDDDGGVDASAVEELEYTE